MPATVPDSELEALAGAGLDWLASDPDELVRFLGHAGLDPAGLRAALGTRPLMLGLIDYFAANEAALLAMAAHSGIGVERVMRAWARLNPAG